MEYGTDAAGEVPRPAFVDSATPIKAAKSPTKNNA